MLVAVTLMLTVSCRRENGNGDSLYRQQMREFVQSISLYARGVKPGFLVIPQNGQELLTENGESGGPLVQAYLDAIDGVGREDLFYGFNQDNQPTPASDREYMLGFLGRALSSGKRVLVTDYCWTPTRIDDSYSQNSARGFISFAADHRDLDNIPPYPAVPFSVNGDSVTSLAAARNFLYLINPDSFLGRTAFLNAIRATNYDLLIVDLFWGAAALTAADVDTLKLKNNGGQRLLIAYCSIGEAEDYRYYWQPEWAANPPSWLSEENPDWPGNYRVRYWDPAWQAIIFGNDQSYLKRILDAGFDGVYLDTIDTFEFFEEQ